MSSHNEWKGFETLLTMIASCVGNPDRRLTAQPRASGHVIWGQRSCPRRWPGHTMHFLTHLKGIINRLLCYWHEQLRYLYTIRWIIWHGSKVRTVTLVRSEAVGPRLVVVVVGSVVVTRLPAAVEWAPASGPDWSETRVVPSDAPIHSPEFWILKNHLRQNGSNNRRNTELTEIK